MSRTVKFLIGLAAVLLMGWVHYGPLGHGAAFIDRLESEARAAVLRTEIPGIEVSLGHGPLSRVATLSGPADQFQRVGQGGLKGLNGIVGSIDGIAGVQWADEEARVRRLPLLAETLIVLAAAYLLGFAIGWLFFGRPKKSSYL